MRSALLLLALPLIACGCTRADERDAFAAARAAIAPRSDDGAHARFQEMHLRRLTGLKGSTAEVVCGEVTDGRTAGDQEAIAPFLYVWKLQPAVPDPGRTAGEARLFKPVDRRAVGEIAQFCDPRTTDHSGASDWTYFY